VPEPNVHGLANIQRTMSLLASSSPAARKRVRLLFYGQSITQSGWSRTVAQELARRYPHADLEVENRAIGGFAADYLVKAAESDLYSYYPDLVVFHVYGAHGPYEDIIRRLRERTTAEILLQTDHVTSEDDLDEERDPARLASDHGSYAAFMSYAFLPALAATYSAAVCDQRTAWKQYLRAQKLPAAALLSDHVHLNAAGDALMAALVLRCLRHAPEAAPSPLERAVTTLRLDGRGGSRVVEFEGNRVDAVTGGRGVARVRIDGKPPSSFRELYGFSRARVNGALWPPLYDIAAEAALLAEDWTLQVDRALGEEARYTFELFGSRSGRDGRGDSRRRFVSRSRRVVIEPDDWNIEYAFELAGFARVPPHFTINFQAEPHFADSVRAAEAGAGKEHIVTLAQGLPEGVHRLELSASEGEVPVAALRIYRPLASPARVRGSGQ